MSLAFHAGLQAFTVARRRVKGMSEG